MFIYKVQEDYQARQAPDKDQSAQWPKQCDKEEENSLNVNNDKYSFHKSKKKLFAKVVNEKCKTTETE